MIMVIKLDAQIIVNKTLATPVQDKSEDILFVQHVVMENYQVFNYVIIKIRSDVLQIVSQTLDTSAVAKLEKDHSVNQFVVMVSY